MLCHDEGVKGLGWERHLATPRDKNHRRSPQLFLQPHGRDRHFFWRR